jgi:chromate transport protein ChrA
MKEKSKFLSVSQREIIKAFFIGLSSTVISVVGDGMLQMFITKGYSLSNIHWPEIGAAVSVAVLGYVKTTFFSNSKGDVFTKEPELLQKQ